MSSIPANHVLGLEFNWHGKKGECINLPSALYTYLSAGSRLCDKGGGAGTPVIQTLRNRGSAGSKKFFSALRASVWSNWIRHWTLSVHACL